MESSVPSYVWRQLSKASFSTGLSTVDAISPGVTYAVGKPEKLSPSSAVFHNQFVIISCCRLSLMKA